MGGLLVRSYIQTHNGGIYKNNIDRFAMVGTPNHGSILAYPLWEGGDPITADNIAGDIGYKLTPKDYFYSQAVDKMYNTRHGEHIIKFFKKTGVLVSSIVPIVPIVPELTKSKTEVLKFITINCPSLRTLMPDESLNFYPCPIVDENYECKKFGTDYKNDLLPGLNKDLSGLAEINVRIFLSDSQVKKTPYKLKVIAPVPLDTYHDGKPVYWAYEAGDGTVTYDSGRLGAPNDFTIITKHNEKHESLIQAFRLELVDFLKENRAAPETPQTSESTIQAAGNVSVAAVLAIGVEDEKAFVLTCPYGNKNGINLATAQSYEESVDVEIIRSSNGMSLSLPDPVDGVYNIDLSGQYSDRIVVTLSYASSETMQELEVPVFFSDGNASFQFNLVSDSASPLTIPEFTLTHFPAAPYNLTATSVGGNTKISWESAAIACPGMFQIYSRLDHEAFFTLMQTVGGDVWELQTDQPFQTPRRLYSVSCMDDEGNESLLSETVSNNENVVTIRDINGDEIIDLKDIIVGLKLLSGMDVSTLPGYKADINGDGKIGMEEVIYILQKVSGLRE